MFHQVGRDPVVHEASDTDADTLIATLCVRGVWQLQCDALFDIQVLDPDTKSYLDCSLTVVNAAEVVKEEEVPGSLLASLTPFHVCVTVDGLLG